MHYTYTKEKIVLLSIGKNQRRIKNKNKFYITIVIKKAMLQYISHFNLRFWNPK